MIEIMLKRVTEAEEKADEIREEAKRQADEIVKQAKQQAQDMKTETMKAMKVRHQEYMQWIQEQSSRSSIDGEKFAEEEADRLKKSVESRKNEAMEAILNLII